VVKILAGPARSIERIQRIQQTLREVQQKQQSREEIQSTIASTAPELSSITSALPTTRVELYAFIGVLLALLTLLVTTYATLRPSGPTQAEIDSMVSKAIEKSEATTTSPEAKPQKKRTAPKVGRNEPCSCGSGKKFKRCCLAAAG
jgi:preprotein translocase subunit SecA